MTHEEIIQLAREAGAFKDNPLPELWESFFINFAALVAAAEREACARLCEARDQGYFNREDAEARRCAAAIRAIGKKAPTLVEKYYGTK